MSSPDLRPRLRELADQVIGPVDGEYRRPWMCAGDPVDARVFIVGINPATPFPASAIEREAYLDALVSDDRRLHDIYLALRGGVASPTRRNTELVVHRLAQRAVAPILETNVWTQPTRDLATLQRAGRTVMSGSTILPALMELLAPAAMIVHGAAATRGLAELLGRDLVPAAVDGPFTWSHGEPTIVAIPSLSPPRANSWLPTGDKALSAMTERIARLLESG